MKLKLTDSANTGEKIMNRKEKFIYNFTEKDNDAEIYYFNWTFYEQSGEASIQLTNDGYIDQKSALLCKDFHRPLSPNNDESLYEVFKMMLDSIKIEHK